MNEQHVRDQEKLLRLIAAQVQPIRMQAAIAVGEYAGIPPKDARRAFWSLLDRHMLILLADNRVIEHGKYGPWKEANP